MKSVFPTSPNPLELIAQKKTSNPLQTMPDVLSFKYAKKQVGPLERA